MINDVEKYRRKALSALREYKVYLQRELRAVDDTLRAMNPVDPDGPELTAEYDEQSNSHSQ